MVIVMEITAVEIINRAVLVFTAHTMAAEFPHIAAGKFGIFENKIPHVL